ncbi:MAG: PAS domain S-box protein, partial [Bacteriovoracaceae bacterium]|nr:PAS domain S-box protein [Bacteriovoracaceae bacterium]
MKKVLPALRKKILRSYFIVVGMFGVVGTSLVLIALFSALALTPKVIQQNYASIEAVRHMNMAWSGLHSPPSYSHKSTEDLLKEFDQGLYFGLGNTIDQKQSPLIKEISLLWIEFKKNGPSTPLFEKMHRYLETLSDLNEKAMYNVVDEAERVKQKIIIGMILFFILALIITLFIVDSLSMRLASPLKAIAEVLRSKPRPGEKLRLPEPNSLEIRILTEELTSLWNRVSRLDQIKVEKVLQQSNQFENLFEAVEDAVIVVDTQGKVTHASLQMAELIGLSTEHIIGHAWNDLPSSSANYQKLRNMFWEQNRNSPVTELIGHQGETRIFAGRFRHVYSPKGEILSYIFLLHDITDVRQMDRLKAEFIGVLSSEINTPLTSLVTAVELLSTRKHQMDNTEKLLIETLAEDVSRIRAISQQLIQLGHLSEAAIKLHLESRDLAVMIPDWIRPFKLLAHDRNIELSFENLTTSQIYVDIDAEKFPWVVSNLLYNSIYAAPEKSHILIQINQIQNML